MFKENRIKDPLIILTLVAAIIGQLFTAKLNPYGLLIMIIGFISFFYSKIPNLREGQFVTSGVDQIKRGYKIFYSCGLILMLIGFLVLIY